MIETVSAEEFEGKWRPIHDRIFSQREVDDRPFASSSWPMALLPGGLLIDDDVVRALSAAAAGSGDSKAVICDGEGEWADEPARMFDLSQDDLEELDCNSVYGHTVSHLFGASEKWGLVASRESFAVFSARPETFSVFLKAMDGIGNVKARFERTSGDVGFGPAGAAYVKRLLAMVGWARD